MLAASHPFRRFGSEFSITGVDPKRLFSIGRVGSRAHFFGGQGSPAQTLTMQDADIALSARIRNDGTLCEPVVPLRRLIQRLGRGKLRVGIANATEPSKTGFRGSGCRFTSLSSMLAEARMFFQRLA